MVTHLRNAPPPITRRWAGGLWFCRQQEKKEKPGQPQCLRHCEPDSIIPRSLSRVRPSEPRDCSPPGSSVHGILQVRTLEWVDIPFSRGLPQPRVKPGSPASQADSLLSGPPGKSHQRDKDGNCKTPSPGESCAHTGPRPLPAVLTAQRGTDRRGRGSPRLCGEPGAGPVGTWSVQHHLGPYGQGSVVALVKSELCVQKKPRIFTLHCNPPMRGPVLTGCGTCWHSKGTVVVAGTRRAPSVEGLGASRWWWRARGRREHAGRPLRNAGWPQGGRYLDGL